MLNLSEILEIRIFFKPKKPMVMDDLSYSLNNSLNSLLVETDR